MVTNSYKHSLFASILILLYSSKTSYANTDSLIREANKVKENPKAQADLYCRISFMELGRNTAIAMKYARTAIDIAKKSADFKELAKAYICITYAYDNAGKIDDGLLTADSALLYANKSESYSLQFKSELLISSLSRRKANYNDAIIHVMKATDIAEKNNDDTLKSNALGTLAILYTNLKDLDRAEQYHIQALELRKKIGNKDLIATSYNNLGIVNRERENYDKALFYYHKALDISLSLKDTASIAFLFNDIGAAYSKKGDVVNGEKYLTESIAIREQIGELNELAYTYNYLGENYERKHDIKNAELYIKKALSIAKDIKNNKQTYEALESLSDFYSRNKMYDSAYMYLNKYKLFKDSIARMDNKKLIAELTTQYETEKKERKIREQQYELERRNYLIISICILVLVILTIVYFVYSRYKLKQDAKLQSTIIRQQEMATRAVIEAEERERKRIAGDLHDGVGQLMSAAKLNLSLINSELSNITESQRLALDKALLLVDESCREVRAVSHNIMPNALLKAGLSSAIREFIDKIDVRILKVNLFTEGINERLPSDTETVLYRVIQECINNVIKHSGANALDISLIKDEEGISVSIEDNGKGFNVSDKSKFDGIGLKNIQTRVEYLKGTVEWDSAIGKGTVITIHLPVT